MPARSISSSWNEVLATFPEDLSDVYFAEQYVKLYEGPGAEAEAFVYRDAGETYLIPYLRHRIDALGGRFYDFETAYGYGGPITTCADPVFICQACDAFLEMAKERSIVAGLIRFHPLLQNDRWVAPDWPVIVNRRTVAMDLTLDESRILDEQVHAKHRASIRKALASGLSFQPDSSFACLERFVSLYTDAMRRKGATEEYHFSPSYFKGIRDALDGSALLGTVVLGDLVVAAAIFLRQGPRGHYHLSADDPEFRRLSPTTLLVFEAAIHLKRLGARLLHLGGGTDASPDNSLYRFKRRFGSLDREFSIGKLIVDADAYAEACRVWEGSVEGDRRERYRGYFLRYRY